MHEKLICPKKIKSYSTLTSVALTKLLAGESLTQATFLYYGSWRLAAIIYHLKFSYGLKIKTRPHKGRAVSYYLPAEEIQKHKKQQP